MTLATVSESRKLILAEINRTLVDRALTLRDLGKITGISYAYLRNIVVGSEQSAPARSKIEAALGRRFWNKEQTTTTL